VAAAGGAIGTTGATASTTGVRDSFGRQPASPARQEIELQKGFAQEYRKALQAGGWLPTLARLRCESKQRTLCNLLQALSPIYILFYLIIFV